MNLTPPTSYCCCDAHKIVELVTVESHHDIVIKLDFKNVNTRRHVDIGKSAW